MYFTAITDSRYKINQISVNFITDFRDDDSFTRSDYAAAAYILTESCKKYPDHKSLSEKLLDLYDGSLTSSTSLIHNTQRRTTVKGGVLDDRYALNGEKLVRELTELICRCIFEPLADNGAFDETSAALMKTELIDTIDSVMNDKSAYAARNAAMIAYKGEPGALSVNGTHEQAEQVTASSAYGAYRKLLETGHIEIMAAGCSDFAESREIFAEAFSSLNRSEDKICGLHSTYSQLKPEPVYVADKFPMQQAILRMYLKSAKPVDVYANKVFAMILGGMTTSRFFSDIREKQSLCYYCSAGINSISRTLVCYAGVEPCNVEKTEEAILAEIRDIRENGVSEDELARAKREMTEGYSSMYDSSGSLISWYMGQLTDKEFLSPAEYAERINKVTAEDVLKAAEYSLDTVYVLMSEENQ